ncbi:DUF4143 domain-containing protein [Flavobacterium aurantiibacter]|uniref:DUF4143 domain-containing protein n=1 Tax=Flavobacterium aurantiibacter TaxID=2023067 RepID=A0A256A2B7_9FLAO|nr:DUF4143 domain-containing protein [Flavobacterium aurantiibacter]OYQ47791.1 hypothetical protein CHX27_02865 [Flavobacterium aurantiibacter]
MGKLFGGCWGYLLPPYYANFGKRITKKPKLYLVDTGIICSLLDITTVNQLEIIR